MKYEIIKLGVDKYQLKYKDKVIDFKSDINTTAKMQKATKLGRLEMLKDLAKEGIAIDSFVITQKKDGKTYVDASNKKALEQAYIEDKMTQIFDEICKEKLGLDLQSLINDIELNEDEIELFAERLGKALTGKLP